MPPGGGGLAAGRDGSLYAPVTSTACVLPLAASNSVRKQTRALGRSALPSSSCLLCANTLSPPPSGSRNPNPFSRLKFFTVPLILPGGGGGSSGGRKAAAPPIPPAPAMPAMPLPPLPPIPPAPPTGGPRSCPAPTKLLSASPAAAPTAIPMPFDFASSIAARMPAARCSCVISPNPLRRRGGEREREGEREGERERPRRPRRSRLRLGLRSRRPEDMLVKSPRSAVW
mmetsp:Transcript_38733/g.90540  ORF Transcript_38733/g.90540 Transcript_38733/m.90540 type:complete len:228 (-) Transcript_38733:112-795(-)